MWGAQNFREKLLAVSFCGLTADMATKK